MRKSDKLEGRVKRQLKVYPKHFQRAYHESVIFPEIRISGKWLKDIGFDCGQIITVLEERNKIILIVEGREEVEGY